MLSTTLSLSALIAAASFIAAPVAHAAPLVGASSARVLTTLVIGDADTDYNLGVTDYQAGNFDKAIADFTSAVKERPKFADAYFNRGLCHEAKKDWKSAIADFTKVFETKPKLADAYVERGRSYAASGDFASAQKDFGTALTIKPRLSDAFLARADSYFYQKQYDAAVADYTQFFSIEPKPDPLVYNNRGLANYAKGNYDAAIADFTKFTTLDPEHAADAYSYLGDAYLQKKEYPAAVTAYSKYIAKHPNDNTGSALKGRALAYLQNMQYQPALTDYTAYLALKPTDPEALTNIVIAQQKLGIDPSANIKVALAHDPNNMQLRELYAESLVKGKNYSDAITQYTTILGSKPDDPTAIFNRGVAYGLLPDYPKAAADMSRYTKAKPSDPAGFNSLAVYYGKQGEWANSAAAFGQLLALKPDDTEALKNRGIANYNLKKYDAAEADLEKYDGIKKGDPEVNKLLLDIASATGKSGVAISRGKIAAAQSPNDPNVWFNLGVAYLNAKDSQSAVDAFTKSIALKRDDQAIFNRGLAYYDLGKAGNAAAYTKAAADASAALALKPSFPDAALLKGDSEFALKQYSESEADYGRYVSMPGLTDQNRSYAIAQQLAAAIQAKDYSGINTVTTSAIAANPNDPNNYQIRGASLLTQRNYDAAIPDLVKYTSLKPEDATGFYNLGIAYSGKKDNANAAAAFEKAASLKPNYYEATYQAALAYKSSADANGADSAKQVAQYDKAVALFGDAATIKVSGKDAADATYNQATALEAKAKATDTTEPLTVAVTVWNKYITLAPTDPELPKIKQHIEDLKAQIARG
jgi:tetratricopeptide (TPR) repeat protein